MYHMPNANGEGTTAISDDWDLDAALQQFNHSIKVVIRDNESPDEHDSNHGITLQEGTTTSLKSLEEEIIDRTSTTSKSLVPVPQRFTLFLEKFVNKIEDYIFKDSLKNVGNGRKKSPMTLREFQNHLDVDGRLVNYQVFRESVYLGGVSPALRKIAWRHLLCVFPEGMTGTERLDYLSRKSQEYTQLRDQWKIKFTTEQEAMSQEMKFVTNMVKKDVIRTDRNHPYYKGREDNKHTLSLFDLLCTYSLTHPQVSYCQGMCDLASPILIIQENEAHAYLLFCSLMERMKYNFSFDSKAISTKFAHLTQLLAHFDPEFYSYLQDNEAEDLLFAYRWLLLEMKREFPFEDSLFFCEVMWSSLPTLPTDKEVQLFEYKTGGNITSSSNCTSNGTSSPITVSPYEHSNSSDTESLLDSGSSVVSIYPECEAISRDQSFIARQEYIDRVVMEDLDDDEESLSEAPPSVSDVCHCDLEAKDSLFLVEEDGEIIPVKCRCATSIDSGILSRPSSPSTSEDNLSQVASIVQQLQIFPPPKEFGFGNPFVLFCALAMILQQRDEIMKKKMDFNDIVLLFTSKSRNKVGEVLEEAKQLYEAYISNDLGADDEEYVNIESLNITEI